MALQAGLSANPSSTGHEPEALSGSQPKTEAEQSLLERLAQQTAGFIGKTVTAPIIEVRQFADHYRANNLRVYESPTFVKEMRETRTLEAGGINYVVRILNQKHADSNPPLLVINALGLTSEDGYQRQRLHDLATTISGPIININSEGFEGSHVNWTQLPKLSFKDIATNMHRVMDQLAQDGWRLDGIQGYGESRGAMILLMMAAQSQDQDHLTRFSRIQALAPSGLGHFSARQTLGSIKHACLDLPVHLATYIKDQDVSHRAYTATRLTGRLGALAAALAHPRTSMPIAVTAARALTGPMRDIPHRLHDNPAKLDLILFDGDEFCGPQRWAQAFAKHPRCKIHFFPGGHLGLLYPEPIVRAITNIKHDHRRQRQNLSKN